MTQRKPRSKRKGTLTKAEVLKAIAVGKAIKASKMIESSEAEPVAQASTQASTPLSSTNLATQTAELPLKPEQKEPVSRLGRFYGQGEGLTTPEASLALPDTKIQLYPGHIALALANWRAIDEET
ncbi:hypothetical protein DV736_g6569, partial [Chaetothyriales sp. CBS 134916]